MPRAKRRTAWAVLGIALAFCCAFVSCGAGTVAPVQRDPRAKLYIAATPQQLYPARSSEPVVYESQRPGTEIYGNGLVSIDASEKHNGYLMIAYTGYNSKVKLQITGPSGGTYTYDLHSYYEAFPLTAGSGNYTIGVFENVSGNMYAPALSQSISVSLADANAPFLRPSQYVDYTADSATVALGASLARGCETDLEVVAAAYNWVMDNIIYDDYKAANVKSGYLPDVDYIIDYGYGICFDYAAVMATMLRTQGIPTKLQVGYTGNIYHAWVDVYVEDQGWINGLIQFDGTTWKLMDPTFADNANQAQWIVDYIANTGNYQIRFEY